MCYILYYNEYSNTGWEEHISQDLIPKLYVSRYHHRLFHLYKQNNFMFCLCIEVIWMLICIVNLYAMQWYTYILNVYKFCPYVGSLWWHWTYWHSLHAAIRYRNVMSDWADALHQPKGPAIMNIRLVTGRTIQRPYRVRADIPIRQRNHGHYGCSYTKCSFARYDHSLNCWLGDTGSSRTLKLFNSNGNRGHNHQPRQLSSLRQHSNVRENPQRPPNRTQQLAPQSPPRSTHDSDILQTVATSQATVPSCSTAAEHPSASTRTGHHFSASQPSDKHSRGKKPSPRATASQPTRRATRMSTLPRRSGRIRNLKCSWLYLLLICCILLIIFLCNFIEVIFFWYHIIY